MGATIISNVCFFIATTLTILYQNRDTAHQLRDSESQRHNENKQRSVQSKELMLFSAFAFTKKLLFTDFISLNKIKIIS